MPKRKKPATAERHAPGQRPAPAKVPDTDIVFLTPWRVFQEALKAVPALKYALGVLGIVSAIAIVRGFGISLQVAVFGTIVMMVLMTALVVFAALTKARSQHVRIAALVMMWSFLALTILSAVLLFTSVFFNYPKPLPEIFGSSEAHGEAVRLTSTDATKGEYERLLNAYCGHPEEAEPVVGDLKQILKRTFLADQLDSSFFTSDRLALAACALLQLGKLHSLKSPLHDASDPLLGTRFSYLCRELNVPEDQIWQAYDGVAPDHETQYYLLLALSRYDAEHLGEYRPRLEQIYREHPNGGVHSVAGWILERVLGCQDVVRNHHSVASPQPSNQQWRAITVPAPYSGNPVTLVFITTPSGRAGISDSEISVSEYLAFRQDDRVSFYQEDGSKPVTDVSPESALDFCAALSKASEKYQFRLPTPTEWKGMLGSEGEAVARERDLLELFALFEKEDAQAPRCLRPNRLGYFDLLGNVSEIICEKSESPQTFYDVGGMSNEPFNPERILPTRDRQIDPKQVYGTMGFRICVEFTRGQRLTTPGPTTSK